jgi:hypothetical protein
MATGLGAEIDMSAWCGYNGGIVPECVYAGMEGGKPAEYSSPGSP